VSDWNDGKPTYQPERAPPVSWEENAVEVQRGITYADQGHFDAVSTFTVDLELQFAHAHLLRKGGTP
jgi:hypothetical protein